MLKLIPLQDDQRTGLTMCWGVIPFFASKGEQRGHTPDTQPLRELPVPCSPGFKLDQLDAPELFGLEPIDGFLTLDAPMFMHALLSSRPLTWLVASPGEKIFLRVSASENRSVPELPRGPVPRSLHPSHDSRWSWYIVQQISWYVADIIDVVTVAENSRVVVAR